MAKKTAKMTYYFGKTKTEGRGVGKEILGGKGLNLAEMTGIGLPVPPGFTITTQVCADYYDLGEKLPVNLMADVSKNIRTLERELKKGFGDAKNPLLVSVRSGAAVSMPGMMNTILNLGLTDVSVEGLATATENRRFAYDAYRRLINMFGDVVIQITGVFLFMLIYVLSLLAGNYFTFINHKNEPNYSAVGASGAVSGIVYSSILLFPQMQLAVLF